MSKVPPPDFKAGFVAIVGRPNVGKSTLINSLLGQKIAAVSTKPQTTRRRQLAMLTQANAQVIFIDTPGIHSPRYKLGEFMNEEAHSALDDADVIVWMVDGSSQPQPEDLLIRDTLAARRQPPPILMAFNKIDRIPDEWMEQRQAVFQALLPQAAFFVISATSGQGWPALLKAIIAHLPQHAPYYDPEQITDSYERDIAADLLREAVLLHLRNEVPHAIAVRIDEYRERGPEGAYIAATLFVEKDSQKGIVIGQNGEMLKRIGTAARQEIERMSGRKVFLELRVKVNKNWRDNPAVLQRLGYQRK
jgi:GTP-binding protein Era